MTDKADGEPTELDEAAQTRWDALKHAVVELAGAAGDADGFAAAFAAMRQVGRGIDPQEVLNAVHVPDDAGEYSQALRRMLVRIPDGWGRWISCSRGWYPILVDLDQQLAVLFPTYEIHQVKEKYGGLRFYWHASERVTDPEDPEPDWPRLGDQATKEKTDAAWAAWQEVHDAWSARLARYLETEDGAARKADLERRAKLAEQLVDAAEERASITCELCGRQGQLCRTQARHAWYQTLCPDCAAERDYVRARKENE
jgi:hypothetical protein